MRLEFTNALALLLLGVIPLTVLLGRRSLASLGGFRYRLSVAARALILLLLVLALSGLRIRTASRDVAVLFLIDVSASVAASSRQPTLDFINEQIGRAGPRDYIGVIAFGREPSVELAPTRRETLSDFKLTAVSSNPPADYTDVAAAVRLAAALIPEDATGRIVLISDGNENLESALDQAALLRAEGIEVIARGAESLRERGQTPEVAITELDAPERLAEGEAFDLKITITATRDADATLRVFRNDTVVAQRAVHLVAQGDNVFAIPQRADEKGFYTFRAAVEALSADTFTQNNSIEAFTIVEGAPKLLYVYGDQSPSQGMLRVLAEGKFAAEARNSAGVPATLAGLQNYDLVIFDNVPASALTNPQMKMVQVYVRELGGGFLMIGGEQSFGPGGYYKTPVEEVLPVSLDVRNKKHLPSLALALVIDKSGSMQGLKMQLTQEAASAVVSFLSERDSVGVIAFDGAPHPVVGMTKAEDKERIIGEVRSIEAGGGTNMHPGLKMAYEWLAAADAQIKHIIVLSDGVSEGGDFRGIARTVRDAGMTLTSVAVGDDADLQTMKFISDIGGGRFYATNSPENLPRIFTQEAFLASRSTIIEEPFVPRLIRSTQATEGIDWSAAPQLLGYVGTAERDDPSAPRITSLISDKDDPVYASWQYGLGRAAAFTSDAKSRWAAGWMKWPGFGQFWTQALRDVVRSENAGSLEPRVEIDAGRGHITVEAATPDGRFANDLRPTAHVVTPDLRSLDVRLEQTAAGRYEADFAATSRGSYLVRIADEASAASAVSGAANSYSPEFNIAAEDTGLLARLSDSTGGQFIGEGSNPPSLFDRRQTKTRPSEIWETLLLAALLILPFDVGVRRLHITRDQVASARDWVRSHLRRRGDEAEIEEARAFGRLKHARTRVRLTEEERGQAMKVGAPTTHSPSQTAEAASTPDHHRDEEPLATRLLDAKRKRVERE